MIETTRRPALLLGVLGLLTAVVPLAIDIYVPGFPALGRDLGAGEQAAQLSMSAFLIGLVGGQLVIGPLSDKLGRRQLLVPGTAAFALLSACCALMPTAPLLVAGRFLQGCAGAAGLVLARAILTDRFAGPRLPVYFSILAMILGVAPVVGPLLGGVIVSASGWRAVFWTLAALGLGMLAATWLGVPESLPPDRRSAGGLRQAFGSMTVLLRQRAFTGYVLTLGFAAAAMFVYVGASSYVFQDVFRLSAVQYGLVFAANAAAMLVASAGFGALSRRVALPRLLSGYVVIATIGALALSFQTSFADTWICLAVVLFGVGGIFPAVTTITQTIGRSQAGAASALSGSAAYLFGALAAPLSGTTLRAMAGVMRAVLVLAVLSLLVARPWRPLEEGSFA
ncbi:DHA1 family bicyclomycin/chloramphenicol resistance-like MFS transporter [Streptosporangium album]|uniref:DHA1 family bicyclomycin/chloramphenicol resistance-like MFS transporter n=1 Tax=Streptosporangium album TaxID=47479 RepID=A0A7W7S3S8_9ACTN|nr:multidrug effflux MFS transporter [Streptosporangium album]MBB4942698.1 DHA1 family bicyclomycin/chloramphenicol resistance-like MFS transporter [Streptosporangium album]